MEQISYKYENKSVQVYVYSYLRAREQRNVKETEWKENESRIERNAHKKLNNILITERMTFADEAECIVCAFIPSNNIALGERDPHGLHLLVRGINEWKENETNQPDNNNNNSNKKAQKKK